MPQAAVLLFSYGTLQNKAVQRATFGRELTGRADALAGYRLRSGVVADPEIAALTGEGSYFNVEPSPDPAASVAGTLFEITEEELAIADEYEKSADYYRVAARLSSGEQAWVYMRMAAS